MFRLLFLSWMLVLLVACSTQDSQYYRNNPQLLQKALARCPQSPPSTVSCEELKAIAVEMNQLAYELQINPQEFGTKILSLQAELAKQQADGLEKPDSAKPTDDKARIQQQLAMRMAAIRWLESPEK